MGKEFDLQPSKEQSQGALIKAASLLCYGTLWNVLLLQMYSIYCVQ